MTADFVSLQLGLPMLSEETAAGVSVPVPVGDPHESCS